MRFDRPNDYSRSAPGGLPLLHRIKGDVVLEIDNRVYPADWARERPEQEKVDGALPAATIDYGPEEVSGRETPVILGEPLAVRDAAAFRERSIRDRVFPHALVLRVYPYSGTVLRSV